MLMPYFVFNGSCEKALTLYQQAFNGKQLVLTRYGEAFSTLSAPQQKMIMHARLQLPDGSVAVLADALPNMPFSEVGPSSTMISFKEIQETQQAYSLLAQKATIKLSLAATAFSPAHAELVDQFGNFWVLTTDAVH